ncbi:Hnt2 [Saccharomyces cerevisiae]|nr:Hnt2 [Saccharomyces cerevisiae]
MILSKTKKPKSMNKPIYFSKFLVTEQVFYVCTLICFFVPHSHHCVTNYMETL